MSKKTFTISESSARALLAKRKSKAIFKEVGDENIDFSEIPELTGEQLLRLKPRFPKPRAKRK